MMSSGRGFVPTLGTLALRRRSALKAIAGGISAVAVTSALGPASAAIVPRVAFLHGVASGDPLPDAVVIWTRVTPSIGRGPIEVLWEIFDPANRASALKAGTVTTDETRDYTVKADVTGLSPATRYLYRFSVGRARSPIGLTKTAPSSGADVAQLKLAFFSCSNFDKGYFSAYALAARQSDLDLAIHLGDYIYEYGPNEYVTPALQIGLVSELRDDQLDPPAEIIVLDQYRRRHATYKSDRNLQLLHRKVPWIVVWDDHETANDSYTDGAENQATDGSEGTWAARKAAGIQAYYEWMPIREPADGVRFDPATGNPAPIYRSFDWGALARIIMLDTRLIGRNQQLSTQQLLGVYQGAAQGFPLDVQQTGQPRTLLGSAQETWFDGQITGSNQTWQLIGNQILYFFQIAADFQGTALLSDAQKAQLSSYLDGLLGAGSGAVFGTLGSLGAPNPATADSWTGYPSAKLRFLGSLAKAANPIIMSGDSHNFWVANIRAPSRFGILPVAVEFGGSSVSSPGYEESFPQALTGIDPAVLGSIIVESSTNRSPLDKLIYAETTRRGFVLLTIDPNQTRADYYMLSSAFTPSYSSRISRFTVAKGAKTAIQTR